MIYATDSLEVQIWVANILLDPTMDSAGLYKQIFPDKPNQEVTEILCAAKPFFDPQARVTPSLIHRLKFCWSFLRQADMVIRKTNPEEFPDIIKQSFLDKLFEDVFPASKIHPIRMQTNLLWITITAIFIDVQTSSCHLASKKR
jgi:hypothetical protein